MKTHWTAKEQQHSHICPSGQRIELRHRAFIKKNGERILIKDVEKHTFDEIQAHKEECLIENILKRSMEGDLAALEVMKGQYADITNAPGSLAEAQQAMITLKESFEHLPKDIRKEFDYNYEKYIAEFGSEEWAEKTGVKAALEKDKAAADAAKKLDEEFAKAIHNIAEPLTQGGGTENE